jgi:hypothetical protein
MHPMPLTVAQVVSATLNALKGWMGTVGMDVTNSAGNTDLPIVIDQALRALGYAVATPLAPSDTDLQPVPDGRLDLLLGVVRLYTLRTCLGRFSDVNEQAGTDKQEWENLGKRMQAAAESLAKDLLERYGFGKRRRRHPRVGAMAAGTPWPPSPPPPMSAPPYPPGTPYTPPSTWFNP